MEKRKYVARPGIEPRTPDLRVRCPTDCATRPGKKNPNLKKNVGGGEGALVSNLFTNNLNLNKKKKWGVQGGGGLEKDFF